MYKLQNHIARITEDYAQGMRLRCEKCGKITELQDEGRGPLLCCNQKMITMAQYTPKLEAGFNKYPKGWDRNSVVKFGKTLSKRMKGGVKSKGFFDKCVKKMRGKVENPEGFCAGVKDETYGSTGWRGKDKSPAKVSADVKKAKFKVEGLDRILEYEEAYWILQCDKENERIEDKLLCLKKAYIMCGANRVCQQRIDRFYDALTGNFEGSGEAPLQTESLNEKCWDTDDTWENHINNKTIQDLLGLKDDIDQEKLNKLRHLIQPTLIKLISTSGGDYQGRNTTRNSYNGDTSGVDWLKKHLPNDWKEKLKDHVKKVARKHRL